jgi:predicted nucleic acid-binding protein
LDYGCQDRLQDRLSGSPFIRIAFHQDRLSREQEGLTLDENDLWIAATASALRATLITRDRDFASIEGLITADWTAV